MRFKRTGAIFMALLLVIPTHLVSAAKQEEKSQSEGSYSEKSEVVYATLEANGDQKEMYVVNHFSIDKSGKIIDYGPYTSVENLTNLTEMKLNDHQVGFTATEDPFYYQGNLEGRSLPWDIDVSYQLNGETLPPEKLLGKDGKLEIHIDTKANEKDNPFFKNYMLQISLPLNSDIYQNIETQNGTIADAGKNKQVAFTVMPEKEESFVVKADVKDLEIESIEITGMPASMPIDTSNADDITNDAKSLSDATKGIDVGIDELNKGITELNQGVVSLHGGSQEYKKGINKLDHGSSELIEGSKSIDESLEKMSQSLGSHSGQMNVSKLQELQKRLTDMANGLKVTENNLADLRDRYSNAYNRLDKSIAAIPAYHISDEEIQELKESDADSKVVDKLVKTYTAARATKDTYSDLKKTFRAVDPTLKDVTGSVHDMRIYLETIVDELDKSLDHTNLDESMKELQQGLNALSSNYKSFHSGLVDYTEGVARLSKSYGELHGGITELTNGTHELKNGVHELHNGTSELAQSTNDLPDQIQTEIDQMTDEYDKSDFDPVSFVSSKNKKVQSVQFVMKTESIKRDKDKKDDQQKEEEKKGFWDRFLDLFR
ncbi:hypothetical protein [Paludifilum halophilum]|uniref:YhgE/Pip domain-containing protein n=1 Tax=Paludifilum halophilum TaxID=1642702 RepID=A0A235BCD1_9BACL|nr:hypothetical protein [Paludifilum halophilum]OYD09953.1 hypothetical protein CHM34_00620 [Paludifilum halophilum]